MAEQYIWPTRRHADLIIRGDAQLDESVATVLSFVQGRSISQPEAS
jgi:hypothetical protein